MANPLHRQSVKSKSEYTTMLFKEFDPCPSFGINHFKNIVTHSVETIMVVGIGVITFRLHDCRSLKGKRKIVKSIIAQLRNNFNISISEVGSNDMYQRAEIGFSLVGNNTRVINAKIDKVFNLADELGLAEIIDSEMEIIHI